MISLICVLLVQQDPVVVSQSPVHAEVSSPVCSVSYELTAFPQAIQGSITVTDGVNTGDIWIVESPGCDMAGRQYVDFAFMVDFTQIPAVDPVSVDIYGSYRVFFRGAGICGIDTTVAGDSVGGMRYTVNSGMEDWSCMPGYMPRYLYEMHMSHSYVDVQFSCGVDPAWGSTFSLVTMRLTLYENIRPVNYYVTDPRFVADPNLLTWDRPVIGVTRILPSEDAYVLLSLSVAPTGIQVNPNIPADFLFLRDPSIIAASYITGVVLPDSLISVLPEFYVQGVRLDPALGVLCGSAVRFGL